MTPPTSTDEQEPVFLSLLTLALGFIIPGAGHLSIGHARRGLVFGITIMALFFGGLLVGGVQSIGPQDQPIWKITQFLAFGPYMIARLLANNYAANPQDFFPKLRDVGSVYCGIAGMLNLLVMFDVLLRITGTTREEPAAKSKPNPSAPLAPSSPPTPPAAGGAA